ncbi:MAG: lysophospholipid acyltransferase family protein [Pseudomonadota bacterium]
MKKLKRIIYTKPFIVLAYYLIRFYSLTFSLKIENEAAWKNLLKQGRPVLLCTWHQQFFSAIRHFKTYARLNPGLMISRSKDGELIAGVANRTGWHTPRGSSSRGGKEALASMIAHIRTHGFGAHILDGPTGPMGKVKPGIIRMAHETQALIVPFHVSADRAWFFNSWDRFMLPRPFSRVTIHFGMPMALDAATSQTEFEQQRRDLEMKMLPALFFRAGSIKNPVSEGPVP